MSSYRVPLYWNDHYGLHGLSGACEDEVARRAAAGYVFRGDAIAWSGKILHASKAADERIRQVLSNNGFTAVRVWSAQKSIVPMGSRADLFIWLTPQGDLAQIDHVRGIVDAVVRQEYGQPLTDISIGFRERANPCGTGNAPILPGTQSPTQQPGVSRPGGTPDNPLDDIVDSIKNVFATGGIALAAGLVVALVILTRK